jgi:hypothetical protein
MYFKTVNYLGMYLSGRECVLHIWPSMLNHQCHQNYLKIKRKIWKLNKPGPHVWQVFHQNFEQYIILLKFKHTQNNMPYSIFTLECRYKFSIWNITGNAGKLKVWEKFINHVLIHLQFFIIQATLFFVHLECIIII